MNTLQEIPQQELQQFKIKVGKWLELDEKISLLETKINKLSKSAKKNK